MLDIEYASRFVKDLKGLRGTPAFQKIKDLCFETIPNMDSLEEIPHFAKMEGHENYYRIRVSDYRIGVKIEEDVFVFMRVLHRKEIYRYFP
ncbi:MAG: type II toxin-antitoxin system RelE family toxin [Saprospiraceae bacterium]